MKKEFTFEERICQDVLLLTIDENFLADVKIISKKYDLPVKDKDRDYDGRPLVFDNENYIKDFHILRKKYNLPESHIFALGYFIEGGCLKVSDSLFSKFWHLNTSEKTKGDDICLMLKIYPNTAVEDIQKAWPKIKRSRDRLLNRNIEKMVKIENLERDLEILKLQRAGEKPKEIMGLINSNKKFNKTILGYTDIPKIIQRLKDMAEKNKARKDS